MAGWVCEMTADQRKLLRQTLRAWQLHRKSYKRGMDFNSPWLANASSRKVSVSNWLNPAPRQVQMNGQQVTFSTVSDPLEIYFMGTYFNTCLSQGGCNQMSVLANAAHANKQVVYAYTGNGTVIGRQLIAINTDMKLVGYHCYANCDGAWDNSKSEAPKYEQMIAEFARYAAQVACSANVEIALEETPNDPDMIGGHFWYDDGIHDWDDAVKESLNQ